MARGGEETGRTQSRSRSGTKTPPLERDRAPHVLVLSAAGTTRAPLPVGRRITIGRSRRADVHVDDESLSRTHACVEHVSEGVFLIEDLGSQNGTAVSGRVVAAGAPVSVRPGAHIELGGAVAIVQYAGLAEQASSTPEDAWRSLDRILPLVAKGSISVLLLGETGVGKEITAQTVHQLSARQRAPFMAIHCAALPESLLEAELFGYERGAFTGATTSKPGLLESAQGGTVFLDEIGEVSLATQAKLLRVLETRSVMRLGSVKAHTIDVRFVSATNRDLEDMVQRGAFRSDLFYRLAGVTLRVPPLRTRVADVASMAREFARDAAKAAKQKEPVFTPAAMECLEAHSWPGNVRELRNVVECAVLLSAGEPIAVHHLPPAVRDARAATPRAPAATEPSLPSPPSSRSLQDDREALERARILEALDRCGGNQTRAAKDLGIGRRTLIDRMAAWGLPRPRKGHP